MDDSVQIQMISALGHCEDTACSQFSSANVELVRLFRCSMHCDRLLCLYHLNAHNISYEEEKKQNDVVLNELQTSLALYQTIFEQHLQEYRQIVHQASTLLLHKSSSIIPIDQIRPVLEQLQRSIALFRPEQTIIKNETIEFEIESNCSKEIPSIKNELGTPIQNHLESNRVVVRLERVEYGLSAEQLNERDSTSESTGKVVPDENQQKGDKRTRISGRVPSGKKKGERTKKKKIPFKRLQT